jgi:hypothetical protein
MKRLWQFVAPDIVLYVDTQSNDDIIHHVLIESRHSYEGDNHVVKEYNTPIKILHSKMWDDAQEEFYQYCKDYLESTFPDSIDKVLFEEDMNGSKLQLRRYEDSQIAEYRICSEEKEVVTVEERMRTDEKSAIREFNYWLRDLKYDE